MNESTPESDAIAVSARYLPRSDAQLLVKYGRRRKLQLARTEERRRPMTVQELIRRITRCFARAEPADLAQAVVNRDPRAVVRRQLRHRVLAIYATCRGSSGCRAAELSSRTWCERQRLLHRAGREPAERGDVSRCLSGLRREGHRRRTEESRRDVPTRGWRLPARIRSEIAVRVCDWPQPRPPPTREFASKAIAASLRLEPSGCRAARVRRKHGRGARRDRDDGASDTPSVDSPCAAARARPVFDRHPRRSPSLGPVIRAHVVGSTATPLRRADDELRNLVARHPLSVDWLSSIDSETISTPTSRRHT